MIATGSLILAVFAAPILVGNMVFASEVILGALLPRIPRDGVSSTPATAVLIPAHNEEDIIADSLTKLLSQLPAHMRVTLVADNCVDKTAEIARGYGVEVLERSVPDLRGKGFALDFGREHLRRGPPQCVIVLDADCDCSAKSLSLLAAAAQALDRPVQGCYLMRTPEGAGVVVQASNFASFVKNRIRQLGLQCFGAPALLNGTGMAFPWRLFEGAKLATGNIVEDLELGLDLVEDGEDPVFLNNAEIWSSPASASATAAQRSRWEGGVLQTARKRGIPMLKFAVRKGKFGAFWLGLHLMTPPLSMLVLLNIVATAISLAVGAFGVGLLVVAILGVTQLYLVIALAAAWFRGGRNFMSASALLQVPRYVLWKVPLYARLLVGGTPEWVRTKRD